jgi:hypothetical protein
MRRLLIWITSRDKREILTFVGTGVAALATAVWTVYTSEASKSDPSNKEVAQATVNPTISPTITNNPVINIHPPALEAPEAKAEVTCQLCVGHDKKWCPSKTLFLLDHGPDTVANWVKAECSKYKNRNTVRIEGPVNSE